MCAGETKLGCRFNGCPAILQAVLPPSYVVDEWLGQSTKTAEEHYLQDTDDHWELGASVVTGGNAGGNRCANTQASSVVTKRKNPGNPLPEAIGLPGILNGMTPMGIEPMLPP